jgi:ASC-1-like (ASCH) protein
MKTHIINIEDEWFRYIISYDKIYEGRIYDEKKRAYCVDDLLDINEIYKVKIKKIYVFDSFDEGLYSLDINNVLPGVKSIDDGVKIYYDMPKYREKEIEYGVCFIEFGERY